MPKKLTTFSMRMPEDINEKIQSYAAEHQCTKAEAMSHFARAGIEIEDSGRPISSDDIAKIEEKIESLGEQGTATSSPAAIVPSDIKVTIQAYSKEHECSESEALGYYARIGLQMTGDQRPATAAEVADLAKKLDVLAQDSQAKALQMKQMAEAISDIHGYTKPEEVEIEGELAYPEIDTPKEPTEEERQQQADERTKKIVSDALDDYLSKAQDQKPERAMSPWVPALIVLAACLAVILVVTLTH